MSSPTPHTPLPVPGAAQVDSDWPQAALSYLLCLPGVGRALAAVGWSLWSG